MADLRDRPLSDTGALRTGTYCISRLTANARSTTKNGEYTNHQYFTGTRDLIIEAPSTLSSKGNDGPQPMPQISSASCDDPRNSNPLLQRPVDDDDSRRWPVGSFNHNDENYSSYHGGTTRAFDPLLPPVNVRSQRRRRVPLNGSAPWLTAGP